MEVQTGLPGPAGDGEAEAAAVLPQGTEKPNGGSRNAQEGQGRVSYILPCTITVDTVMSCHLDTYLHTGLF